MDNELDAVRKDYMFLTSILRQLEDGVEHYGNGDETSDNDSEHLDRLIVSVESVIIAIKDRKADLFAKYNI